MTLAQLEERVMALEEAVAELRQSQLHLEKPAAELAEDEIIPGAEYPIVLSAPPAEVIRVQARIRSIRSGSHELPLTDEEWAMFAEGEDHGS